MSGRTMSLAGLAMLAGSIPMGVAVDIEAMDDDFVYQPVRRVKPAPGNYYGGKPNKRNRQVRKVIWADRGIKSKGRTGARNRLRQMEMNRK